MPATWNKTDKTLAEQRKVATCNTRSARRAVLAIGYLHRMMRTQARLSAAILSVEQTMSRSDRIVMSA